MHFFNVFETRLSPTEDSTLQTATEIKINSLTVKLINRDYDLAHGQVEKISININCGYDMKEVIGEFGSILVKDLTPYGQLYRNRFTTDNHVRALRFKYCRKIQENVSNLIMEANPLIYMHTNRFVGELRIFFINFRKLRDVFEKIRSRRAKKKTKTSGCNKMVCFFKIFLRLTDIVLVFLIYYFERFQSRIRSFSSILFSLDQRF